MESHLTIDHFFGLTILKEINFLKKFKNNSKFKETLIQNLSITFKPQHQKSPKKPTLF
jgi:hypothetical protein